MSPPLFSFHIYSLPPSVPSLALFSSSLLSCIHIHTPTNTMTDVFPFSGLLPFFSATLPAALSLSICSRLKRAVELVVQTSGTCCPRYHRAAAVDQHASHFTACDFICCFSPPALLLTGPTSFVHNACFLSKCWTPRDEEQTNGVWGEDEAVSGDKVELCWSATEMLERKWIR